VGTPSRRATASSSRAEEAEEAEEADEAEEVDEVSEAEEVVTVDRAGVPMGVAVLRVGATAPVSSHPNTGVERPTTSRPGTAPRLRPATASRANTPPVEVRHACSM